MTFDISRRRLITGTAVTAASVALTGCNALDSLSDTSNSVRNVLERANELTYRAQRLLLGDNWLAQEFSDGDIRQGQKPNGTTDPEDEDYRALAVELVFKIST